MGKRRGREAVLSSDDVRQRELSNDGAWSRVAMTAITKIGITRGMSQTEARAEIPRSRDFFRVFFGAFGVLRESTGLTRLRTRWLIFFSASVAISFYIGQRIRN